MVAAVLGLTASLLAGGLLYDAAQRRRAAVEEQLSETARALSLAVDGEILRREAVLHTLAASQALQSGDLKAFETEARASAAPDSWVLLFDSKGRILFNTSSRDAGPHEFHDHSIFVQRWAQLQKADAAITGLLQRRGRYLFHLHQLVRVDGRPTYDLVAAVTPQALQNLFVRQALPPSWYETILDPGGVLVARNKDPQRWLGVKLSEALVRAVQKRPTGVHESRAKDGVLTLAAFNRSPATGWIVGVAVPRRLATGDLAHSLQWLSLAGAVLLLTSIGLTLWFVRGAARAVHGLERYAESLGRGEAGPPEPTGLQETDFIAQALAAAAERVRTRELELARINENLETRVQEASAQLVQSQKIEVIGRLTGGVAHDFNNLLTAVIGNLELLRRKLTDERLLQFVLNARSAADRGAKLTAQLLAFARKQALMREAVDVNAMILGMGELLASTLSEQRRIETRLDPDCPPALADRTQLEMVLLNLVINARDAIPADGVIEIDTGRERIDQPSSEPEHPPAGDFVRISVSDNGVGMPREVMERAFEPFFTTKPPGRGSGLGLPQALGVAQQLGGGVQIESHPGQGAQVHVYLPVAVVESSAPEAPRRRALTR